MDDKERVIRKLEELLEYSRYNDSVGWNPDSDTKTLRDAIALLKAQEPRVLVLDEIHSSMAVWLEDVDKADVILAIVVVPDGICRCFITADNRRISPSNNDYRVRWRAWTSEPTDEMRKAVKWDD